MIWEIIGSILMKLKKQTTLPLKETDDYTNKIHCLYIMHVVLVYPKSVKKKIIIKNT